MMNKLLRLGKDTAVYGLSSILGRLINFLLAPFYTNVLLTSENGAVANLYAYVAFAYVVYCFGLEPAYMRFVSSLEIGDKKQNFSTPFISLALSSLALSLVVHLSAPILAVWIGIPQENGVLIRYAAWILCFDALAVIPFASLRMDGKPRTFAFLKLFNICTTVVLNLVLIVALHMRMEGVFLANLIASIFTFGITFFIVRRHFVPAFSTRLYRELLKFGLPLIPSGLAGIALQIVDRPIVKALTNDSMLGIYQLNYRLGIAMMLVVGMFDYAWRPFFLTNARDPEAKALFSKVFTYFILSMMTMFLTVSLFVEDLVRIELFGKHFFHPDYWQGVGIVPWILLAYVFNGAYVVFLAGTYLEKKTSYLPLVTGMGALVNVIANYVLIPPLGILGAALATLASYVCMAVAMYVTSQRYYPIKYEWNRVLGIGLSAVIAFALYRVAAPTPLSLSGTLIKSGLLMLFLALLPLLKVFGRAELAELKTSLRRLTDQSRS